jgi:hypothetical protein
MKFQFFVGIARRYIERVDAVEKLQRVVIQFDARNVCQPDQIMKAWR